jgi:hypothetical protein
MAADDTAKSRHASGRGDTLACDPIGLGPERFAGGCEIRFRRVGHGVGP